MDAESYIPGQHVKSDELRRVALTVAHAIMNPSELVPYLPPLVSQTFVVQTSWDIEHFANSMKQINMVSKYGTSNHMENELARHSKFFEQPQDLRGQEDPCILLNKHGRIGLWYLPGILSPSRVVSHGPKLVHPYPHYPREITIEQSA